MALEPLVHQAVQQRPAVVTEGGAGVAVGPELVKPSVCTATSVLQQQQQQQTSGGKAGSAYVCVSSPVCTRTVKGYKLMTSSVENKAAHWKY